MKTYSYDCVVVGSGAAGFCAANTLARLEKKSVALVTEGINCGTSRNTGSDKQTYYKLSMAGFCPDSVHEMASDLFAGGSVDGDNALCEAACSVRAFSHLNDIGLKFPYNEYGEYVGYITDHDTHGRATSVGPLTSKFMTEALEREASQLQIDIFDNTYALQILCDVCQTDTTEKQVIGLVCLNTEDFSYGAFKCNNIILATGGPAGIYSNSVYPASQFGSTSLALVAGAHLQNMTEWQYGLASLHPRWNVSGSYMQVLPRFVSVDDDGKEHEFLLDYYDDKYEALSNIFLKGYQWPFHSDKAVCSGANCQHLQTGLSKEEHSFNLASSAIDLYVYCEQSIKGRKVYLDFTKNPFSLEQINFDVLSKEARDYLVATGSVGSTPIERLNTLNKPAIDFYASKGVDITKEYLEIGLCAQHNNGGISVDSNWQTCVAGLYAVGECSGTHGVARPGGSALNAGQVGAMRAATHISYKQDKQSVEKKVFIHKCEEYLNANKKLICSMQQPYKDDSKLKPQDLIVKVATCMSANAAAVRENSRLNGAKQFIDSLLEDIRSSCILKTNEDVLAFYKLKDQLLTAQAVVAAIIDFSKQTYASRGSALYACKQNDADCVCTTICPKGLSDDFSFVPDDKSLHTKIQEIYLQDNAINIMWRDVRPIPKDEEPFENIWARFLKIIHAEKEE